MKGSFDTHQISYVQNRAGLPWGAICLSLQKELHQACPLLVQLNDAFDNPHKLSKFIVEVLYGSGNKAAGMLPQTTYTPRKEGEAQFQKQLRRAAACATLVSLRQI